MHSFEINASHTLFSRCRFRQWVRRLLFSAFGSMVRDRDSEYFIKKGGRLGRLTFETTPASFASDEKARGESIQEYAPPVNRLGELMEYIEIEILNWEKFQLRPDTKSNSWFRLDHDLFDDDQFFSFTVTEIAFFVYILCIASRKNSGNVTISVEKACVRFKKQDLLSAIDKLQGLHILLVQDRTRPDAAVNGRPREFTSTTDRQTDIQTDKHTDRTHPRAQFDFDKIYDLYPRKMGKKRGVELCKAKIKTQELYDQLLGAVQNYTAHIKRECTEPSFVKYFSSFMAEWSDWTDASTGKFKLAPATPRPPQGLVALDVHLHTSPTHPDAPLNSHLTGDWTPPPPGVRDALKRSGLLKAMPGVGEIVEEYGDFGELE